MLCVCASECGRNIDAPRNNVQHEQKHELRARCDDVAAKVVRGFYVRVARVSAFCVIFAEINYEPPNRIYCSSPHRNALHNVGNVMCL